MVERNKKRRLAPWGRRTAHLPVPKLVVNYSTIRTGGGRLIVANTISQQIVGEADVHNEIFGYKKSIGGGAPFN